MGFCGFLIGTLIKTASNSTVSEDAVIEPNIVEPDPRAKEPKLNFLLEPEPKFRLLSMFHRLEEI
jgi:hypothetical protein